MLIAGWSSLEAREAHNLKVAGSNPAPATPQPSRRPSYALPGVAAARVLLTPALLPLAAGLNPVPYLVPSTSRYFVRTNQSFSCDRADASAALTESSNTVPQAATAWMRTKLSG
jgi:hypothetical protein